MFPARTHARTEYLNHVIFLGSIRDVCRANGRSTKCRSLTLRNDATRDVSIRWELGPMSGLARVVNPTSTSPVEKARPSKIVPAVGESLSTSPPPASPNEAEEVLLPVTASGLPREGGPPRRADRIDFLERSEGKESQEAARTSKGASTTGPFVIIPSRASIPGRGELSFEVEFSPTTLGSSRCIHPSQDVVLHTVIDRSSASAVARSLVRSVFWA